MRLPRRWPQIEITEEWAKVKVTEEMPQIGVTAKVSRRTDIFCRMLGQPIPAKLLQSIREGLAAAPSMQDLWLSQNRTSTVLTLFRKPHTLILLETLAAL